MTTYTETRKPRRGAKGALIIRHIRKGIRIRILQIFAIDRQMRAEDPRSCFELAVQHDRRIQALTDMRLAHEQSQRLIIR